MKIAVLGTGIVGMTIASRLIELNRQVMMGSRNKNNEKALAWVLNSGTNASSGNFEEAAKFGEIIFNCTKGDGSIEALTSAGQENLKGKIIIDLSNPLDFSKGMPPTLFISNTNSLGEEIQKTFPDSFVVKCLNTMTCSLMVNPRALKESHNVFICGNNADAKSKVKDLLQQFGWKSEEFIDIGDITSSRAAESYLPLWLRIYMTTKSANFNIKIVS